MSEELKFSPNKYTKILVPASSYNIPEDAIPLIPFTSGDKIGFVNREGTVIISPKL